MKTIKFRGETMAGEFVCGYYCKAVYNDIGTIHTVTDEGGEEFIVDPDSVAQLVGYDKDGHEVYEGDIIIVPCGTEIAARFFDNITENAKLKEAQS